MNTRLRFRQKKRSKTEAPAVAFAVCGGNFNFSQCVLNGKWLYCKPACKPLSANFQHLRYFMESALSRLGMY